MIFDAALFKFSLFTKNANAHPPPASLPSWKTECGKKSSSRCNRGEYAEQPRTMSHWEMHSRQKEAPAKNKCSTLVVKYELDTEFGKAAVATGESPPLEMATGDGHAKPYDLY